MAIPFGLRACMFRWEGQRLVPQSAYDAKNQSRPFWPVMTQGMLKRLDVLYLELSSFPCAIYRYVYLEFWHAGGYGDSPVLLPEETSPFSR